MKKGPSDTVKSTSVSIIVATVLLMTTIFLSGCAQDPQAGYSLISPHRTDVKSVAVSVFTRGKKIYRRELEMRLTEAIIKRIQLDTPYKVVPKSRADTQLTGTLEGISQRVMSYTPDTQVARELEMILTVSFQWEDLRTGTILAEDNNLKAAGEYIRPEPYEEDFYTGSEEAINNAAKRIVEHMEREW